LTVQKVMRYTVRFCSA